MIWILSSRWAEEKECKLCGSRSIVISDALGVCNKCLVENGVEALKIILDAHRESRGRFGLPGEPPRDPGGVPCGLCGNNCIIPAGGKGFCGLVENRDGRIVRLAGTPDRGVVTWYYDPLPTNCVADWVCPGCTGVGYPEYSYSSRGAERGYYNLAVFYGACNLDCLYCQNWQYRNMTRELSPIRTARELASAVNDRVSCVCYFGGDPSPQMQHALEASRIMVEEKRGRILRVCWETNGLMNNVFLDKAVELSLETGGIVKFDIKAWTPTIYRALTGVDCKKIFENLERAIRRFDERPEVPLVTVSTLLVPGYVGVSEVEKIAEFIASLNPNVPYRLLAFHPDYLMSDLPTTSRRHAEECLKASRRAGLRRVSIGNVHILSNIEYDYY